MLTILLPIYNEIENLPQLLKELRDELPRHTTPYEILFIDDGSTDGTNGFLEKEAMQDKTIRLLSFRKNFGKSAALQCGFRKCLGDIVITMDGDLQDVPKEIPILLKKLEEGYDMVCAWRNRRQDPLIKRILSKIYNIVTSKMTNVKLHDFNCGFKAYRRQVLKEIEVYGELHRFLPVLAAWRGFRITETPVQHRPRAHGKSKYGGSRIYAGFFDLITTYYITRFQKKPSRFFYGLGGLLFVSGSLIDAQLLVAKMGGHAISQRLPYIMLGLLLTLAGIQLICTGLLSEFMSHFYHRFQKEYSIRNENIHSS